MKTGFLLALFVALELNCFGDDTNQVFTGGWSQSVNGIRSRLVVSIEHEAEYSRAAVYLELHNVSDSVDPIEFNSGFSLMCQLTNSKGEPLSPSGSIVDHFIPQPYWIDVPYDSTLKLRVDDPWASVFRFKGQTGVSMSLGLGYLIPDNTTNEYFLTGVFRVPPPTQGLIEHPHPWDGAIRLPQVRIYFHR